MIIIPIVFFALLLLFFQYYFILEILKTLNIAGKSVKKPLVIICLIPFGCYVLGFILISHYALKLVFYDKPKELIAELRKIKYED